MATRTAAAGGVVTEQWSNGANVGEPASGYYSGSPLSLQRALSAQESIDLAAADTANLQAGNASMIQQQAQNALVNNRTYLALANPNTAQNTAQIKALTNQAQALIRLALQQFDATT